MTDNKFKSKQELNDYIKNNSTSFEEFEKRLDYSKFDKFVNKTKKQKGFSWKKLGYALASLMLMISLGLGLYEIFHIKDVEKCPYELGTYTYYSQEGDIEGLDFSEESYVILTDQELSGPGTFVLQDKDWVVYGQFYECEFENKEIYALEEFKNKYNCDNSTFEIQYNESNNNNYLFINLSENNKYLIINFYIQN